MRNIAHQLQIHMLILQFTFSIKVISVCVCVCVYVCVYMCVYVCVRTCVRIRLLFFKKNFLLHMYIKNICIHQLQFLSQAYVHYMHSSNTV